MPHHLRPRSLPLAALVIGIQTLLSSAFLAPLAMHPTLELFGWSRQVDTSSDPPEVRDCSSDQKFDLSSAREWLEFWEDQYQAGAYTVLRCDFGAPQARGESLWNVWGEGFHTRRLQDSYRCLAPDSNEEELECLTKSAQNAMEILLSEGAAMMNDNEVLEEGQVVKFMLTILWQITTKETKVKGHISALPPAPLIPDPDPITAVVAVPDRRWPNRKDFFPEAKLSSWCRQRRPVEEGLKPSGVSEVLLVRERDDEGTAEILEGLISNVFFVYKGGTIRTARSGVLPGFARQLVLQHAEDCGLIVDDTQKPVLVKDANQWDEIFVTSSIRILTPVNRLLIPRSYGPEGKMQETETLWASGPSTTSKGKAPFWSEVLLERIVKAQSKL